MDSMSLVSQLQVLEALDSLLGGSYVPLWQTNK